MAEQSICGFCGKAAEHVVEGPNGAYACWNCLLEAKDIIVQMQKTYTCNFCLEPAAGNSVVEGPTGLHMCQACIESGIKLLRR